MATATIPTYTKAGAKAATAAKLDATVFAVMPENHELLKLAYTAYLANGRENLAKTKTRGLVSGGGRKPWKQKGTGRARFGSTRNPIWRGGGIVFGPTGNENYVKAMSTKAKRQAIRQALSLASQEGKVSVIESFDVKTGKTSDAVKLLAKLGADRSVLMVVDNQTPAMLQATNNLDYIKVVQARYINVYDAMNAHYIVITNDGLTAVNEWLGETK